MAMLMWQHGEEATAKALVAAKLYKALAHEAADDDLETEVYEELRSYAKEFEALGKIVNNDSSDSSLFRNYLVISNE